MSAGGAQPAGSGRVLRLDPFALPLCFGASDANADGRVRLVELNRKGVVLRRLVRGIRMTVALPLSSFVGVAIRLVPPEQETDGAVAVFLEHSDPELSVPLFAALDGTDVLAEWRLWARVLGLPLLAADADGALHEAFARLGAVRVARPARRRRRCGVVAKRRPRILMRRKPARLRAITVHREREIIARN
jgi:Family of unknown function (DUF6101)